MADREVLDSAADDALLDALVQTSFAVIAVVSEVASRHDLSLTQLRVLAILRDRAPTMSELAAHLGLDRSTVSGLINRATQRGLVQRVDNDADKRSSRVALTELGKGLAAGGAGEIAEQVKPALHRLDPDDRGRLARLLGDVLAAAEQDDRP